MRRLLCDVYLLCAGVCAAGGPGDGECPAGADVRFLGQRSADDTRGAAGKVTVLLFWTRDCINCKHNLGCWNTWAQTYRGDVSVISVHTPETRYERTVDGTRRFAQSHGLQFPILVDNDERTWNAFGVESWPTEILIDKRGQVRAEYAGELNWQNSGAYKTVRAKIEQLRREQIVSR